MSSRAIRKAQREAEEKRRQEQVIQANGELQESSADDEPIPARSGQSMFALLNAGGEDDDDDNDETIEGIPQDEAMSRDQEEHNHAKSMPKPNASAKRKKKKRSKAKQKQAEQESTNDGDVDEIDLALRSLAAKTPGSPSQHQDMDAAQHSVGHTREELCRLLSINTAHLHASNEMRRLFGRVALEDGADGDEAVGGPQGRRIGRGGRGVRVTRHQGGGLSAFALRRNVFVQGKEDWPKATSGGGLGMEVLTKCEGGSVEYGFVRSGQFHDVQSQFDTLKTRGDHQSLLNLLQLYPYHTPGLLLIVQTGTYHLPRDISTVLLERGLFALGRATHSTFPHSISTGIARLPYRYRENRDLYHFGARYACYTPVEPNAAAATRPNDVAGGEGVGGSLGQRGLFRTAFEWAKLILSLDPEHDPYCVRLYLDVLALRAGEGESYRTIAESAFFAPRWTGAPTTSSPTPPDPISNDAISAPPTVHLMDGVPLPNVLFSIPLTHLPASREIAKHSLLRAIKILPHVACCLYQGLHLEPVPRFVRDQRHLTCTETLLMELYLRRGGAALWKEERAMTLLKECGLELDRETTVGDLGDLAVLSEDDERARPCRDIVRFVRLLEDPVLVQLLDLQSSPMAEQFGAEFDYSDPLPPLDST